MSPISLESMHPSEKTFRRAILAIALAAAFIQPVQGAAGPEDPRSQPGSGDSSSADEALREESAVARMLARLDESLDLGTFPDGSPLWPARLAASIEARGEDEPAQALLRRLAVELRGLGVEWTLGGPPDERPDGRPAAASPEGRERAERIRRNRELVELVNRKLGLSAPPGIEDRSAREARASRAGKPSPGSNRLAPKDGSDACGAAPSLSLGETSGNTFGATNDGDASCAGPTSSPDVWYVFTPPEDGTYTFETLEAPFFDHFDTVLSLHAGCPLPDDTRELACSDDVGASLLSSISHPLTGGEPVRIRVSGYGGAFGDYNLRVSLDRTVRGTVTREDTGAPVAGATVEVFDSFSDLASEATTGTDGSYEAGVAAGPRVRVRVRDDRFVTELYDGQECAFPFSCSPFGGDEISTSSSDVSGIDFALRPGGSIFGSIVAADTGELPDGFFTHVVVYDEEGGVIGSKSVSSAGGSFELSSLRPGTYYLWAESDTYQAEVWDDRPCSSPCDPTTGSPIVVGEGSTVSGIDFVLERLGSIEGVVTEAGDGTPVASEQIVVYRDSGDFAGSAFTRSDGSYEVSRLGAGDHFATTSTTAYLDELYDDVPCEPDCDPTAGTPIPVELGAPTSGIDFALVPRATISGTVTDRETGEPLHVQVFLYDASGNQIRSDVTSFPVLGEYEFRALDAGTYYLRAGFFGQQGSHEEELYDDILCEPGCDPTAGTPVVTTATSRVTGIDFALDRRGWITGRVTDATTGQPVFDVPVAAYSLDGVHSVSDFTETDGTYELRNLAGGNYRVGTNTELYQNEMYDGVVCGRPCDRTIGTPVDVRPTLETAGIDFALTRLGSISGRVTDASTGGHVESRVQLLDPSGTPVASADASFQPFELAGIPPGTYRLLAREDFFAPPYQDELYPDVPCQPDCDLSEGTPIVVELESVLTGYDFTLARCPHDSRHEVAPGTVDTHFKGLACDRVTASGVTLAPGADVTFRSGRSVVLGDGFKVEAGARLQVIIEPQWSAAD